VRDCDYEEPGKRGTEGENIETEKRKRSRIKAKEQISSGADINTLIFLKPIIIEGGKK